MCSWPHAFAFSAHVAKYAFDLTVLRLKRVVPDSSPRWQTKLRVIPVLWNKIMRSSSHPKTARPVLLELSAKMKMHSLAWQHQLHLLTCDAKHVSTVFRVVGAWIRLTSDSRRQSATATVLISERRASNARAPVSRLNKRYKANETSTINPVLRLSPEPPSLTFRPPIRNRP
jgi:hypothetical protein